MNLFRVVKWPGSVVAPVVVAVVNEGVVARDDLAEQGVELDGKDPRRRGYVRETLHNHHSEIMLRMYLTTAARWPPSFPS